MIETNALVVEDDADIRKQLVRALRRSVRHVDEADNGITAMELFAAHQYAVIVLDLRLPRLDGLELFRRVRKLNTSVQVIVMTGHGSKDDAVEAVNLQAFRFFEKPANLDDLEVALGDAYTEYVSRTHYVPPGFHASAELERRGAILYEELADLSVRLQASGGDPTLKADYDTKLKELRELQTVEAEMVAQEFRDRLPLQSGHGSAALEKAREELRNVAKTSS